MRASFPGNFRLSPEEFDTLWDNCIFAVDANVLLNFYRYSASTRIDLEGALGKVGDRIFIPHQAAKEYLKNRLNVTALQANEYNKAAKNLSETIAILSNKKKHPSLPDDVLKPFLAASQAAIQSLQSIHQSLLSQLSNDDVLDFVDNLFSGKVGKGFSKELIQVIDLSLNRKQVYLWEC
ncbi:MAG: hypothetical protein H7330_03790 [Hymenobacteraceae bacterium]|nr:hypothetical protein [Hymenobacteraceae bacterium]